MSIEFEWDEAKNLANLRKHGVSFEDAMDVFLDPLAFSRQDRIQDGELRWHIFGRVDGLPLLAVVHTVAMGWAEEVEVVRIISARHASPKERRLYEAENS